jgi:hypothetical protein
MSLRFLNTKIQLTTTRTFFEQKLLASDTQNNQSNYNSTELYNKDDDKTYIVYLIESVPLYIKLSVYLYNPSNTTKE